MNLKELGWNEYFEKQFNDNGNRRLVPGRVIMEHREMYRIATVFGELTAVISGKFRFMAEEKEDFPAVGDWVVAEVLETEGKAIIQSILPRKTKFSRKIAGNEVKEQIVAANFDTVFIVNSLNRDLNLRRIERYLILAWESGALPVIILSKADLCENVDESVRVVEAVAVGVPVYVISSLKRSGFDQLETYLGTGKSIVVLGSSGVGKSTLINTLAGSDLMETQEIREDDDKGKHTTTHRQLIMLQNGGMLIDTPGMRELQLWDGDEGIGETFNDIEGIAVYCKFNDCSHSSEPGCAVKEAIKNGQLERKRFENYLKLKRELLFIESKQNSVIRMQQKKKRKEIAKFVRNNSKG